MLRLFIFLVFVVFEAEARDNEITITIKSREDKDGVTNYFCDHDIYKENNKYTVREGEEFKIITKCNDYINYFICRDYTNNQKEYTYKSTPFKNVTTFIAEKNMGTLWNCMVLTSRDSAVTKPVVQYEGQTYAAAFCFMQIHVRQTHPPQTILVNNMVLNTVRADLSEKNVDFTTEYQYVDGDLVNVACVNFRRTVNLAMEYPMADKLSDKFTSRNLPLSQTIGFSTRLHSGHNNSYMTCTNTGMSDYTTVMVRFVMRTEFKVVCIKINGKTLRPILGNQENNQYIIEYKYMRYLPIKVVCEVERSDVVLVVTDSVRSSVSEVRGYSMTELIPTKKSEMSFHLSGENKTLTCGSDYLQGRSAEVNTIIFSMGNFMIDYSVHIELPSNGTVMQLYGYEGFKSRDVIFYEFEDGEKLQLKCGPLHLGLEVLYLQFKDSACKNQDCYVSQNLTVTDQHDNSETVCRLMEQNDIEPSKDKVLKEIRVIFRKKVLTTTATTTATTTTTTTNAITTEQKTDNQKSTQTNILAYSLSAVGALIFVVLQIVYLKAQKRCCFRTRSRAQMPLPSPDPAAGAYYENMLSVFAPINEREAAAMENHYEEIQ